VVKLTGFNGAAFFKAEKYWLRFNASMEPLFAEVRGSQCHRPKRKACYRADAAKGGRLGEGWLSIRYTEPT